MHRAEWGGYKIHSLFGLRGFAYFLHFFSLRVFQFLFEDCNCSFWGFVFFADLVFRSVFCRYFGSIVPFNCRFLLLLHLFCGFVFLIFRDFYFLAYFLLFGGFVFLHICGCSISSDVSWSVLRQINLSPPCHYLSTFKFIYYRKLGHN